MNVKTSTSRQDGVRGIILTHLTEIIKNYKIYETVVFKTLAIRQQKTVIHE